ncbi:MAG: hypothetical protein FWH41_06325 [Treponema sp.]|nr:hypothetical protein [Treponema sp.]
MKNNLNTGQGKPEAKNAGPSISKNLVNMGMPIETVVSATQLDPEKIKGLYGFQMSNE